MRFPISSLFMLDISHIQDTSPHIPKMSLEVRRLQGEVAMLETKVLEQQALTTNISYEFEQTDEPKEIPS